MPMPGLLIEYFITGSVALIWLLPFLNWLGYSLPQDTTYLTLFVPGIYVLGMFIDFVSGYVTRPFKRRIQVKLIEELHYARVDRAESHFPEIQSFLYAPDL